MNGKSALYKISYKRRLTLGLLASAFLVILVDSFKSSTSSGDTSLTINLKLIKAYPSQSMEDLKTGVLWSFSYLGASLPKGVYEKAFVAIDSNTYALDIQQLGFNERALKALAFICDSIENTATYKNHKSIDLSRFLVLTLHSSWHYYQITGAYKTLTAFNEHYAMDQANVFGVTKSTVTSNDRLIKIKSAEDPLKMAFMAIEGKGSLQHKTFNPESFEVMDVMPNGQLRFAVYNKEGELIASSPKDHSLAGKPSKCMWCHELIIQPLVNADNIPVNGMMSNEAFEKLRSDLQTKLDTYRKGLNTEIQFENKQDHTKLELLYISFMQASLQRTMTEFPELNATQRDAIMKMNASEYEEFPFIGNNLYHRFYIDSIMGIRDVNVPLSVREEIGSEINYFKNTSTK